jgi:hypothetical protein
MIFRRLVCIKLTYRKQDKIVALAAQFVPRIPISGFESLVKAYSRFIHHLPTQIIGLYDLCKV